MISQALPRLRVQLPDVKSVPGTFRESRGLFKKVKKIGAGAFGTAFSAIRKDTREKVIIKTATGVRGLVSRSLARESLEREIRVLMRLQKFPFVPRVIIVGRDFFVQEDVGGESMINLLDRKGLEPREILSAVIAMGVMASELHREGVAHNDLEPRNVLLTPNGVVLIDFGLSIIRGDQPQEFSGAMVKDLVSLLETAVLVADAMKLPQNVRITIISVFESMRRRITTGMVDEETARDFARQLFFASAQLGARAVRGGNIRREKVRVIAV